MTHRLQNRWRKGPEMLATGQKQGIIRSYQADKRPEGALSARKYNSVIVVTRDDGSS